MAIKQPLFWPLRQASTAGRDRFTTHTHKHSWKQFQCLMLPLLCVWVCVLVYGVLLIYLAFVWPRSTSRCPPFHHRPRKRVSYFARLSRFFRCFGNFQDDFVCLLSAYVYVVVSVSVSEWVCILCPCVGEYLCEVRVRQHSWLSACSEIFSVCGCIAHRHKPTEAMCCEYACVCVSAMLLATLKWQFWCRNVAEPLEVLPSVLIAGQLSPRDFTHMHTSSRQF